MKSLRKNLLSSVMGFFLLTVCQLIIAVEIKNTAPPAPKAVGSSKIQFTDSQVIPPEADTYYPFNTIGKLSFTKSNGTQGVCTATVVEFGIVATAGHCIHSGNGTNSGWSYNFQFAPAYRNGVAPYGIWKSQQVAYRNTSEDWYYHGGKLPHAADYGVIVFKKNSSDKLIGDYTDALSYWPSPLLGRQVTVFGYPNNLDKGTIKHRVDSIVTKGANNTGVFGSNMSTGSDGGPIIANFGAPSDNEPGGWGLHVRNTLVGVVSYTAKTSLMQQGGSPLGKNFMTLVSNTCRLYPWACPGGGMCQKFSPCP